MDGSAGSRPWAPWPPGSRRSPGAPVADDSWAFYGHDAGGQRFSPLSQVNKANVAQLSLAWTFLTTATSPTAATDLAAGWKPRRLFIDGRLYLTSAFNRIIALDPATGRRLWAYDPKINIHTAYGDGLINRGVAAWRAPGRGKGGRLQPAPVRGHLGRSPGGRGRGDRRPCAGFGRDGEVSLRDAPGYEPGFYHMTSPPAVIDGIVVVGSAIDDNAKVEMPGGVVRGYDARTGVLRWSWTPLAPSPDRKSGAANAWSIMTVDPKRHLVFAPTGSASPDYYGGLRPGDNRWAELGGGPGQPHRAPGLGLPAGPP